MTIRTAAPTTAEDDAVMSWLQDQEMRDHKLADARSGIGSSVLINTVIGRMQVKALAAFPKIDRETIEACVRRYVDPKDRLRTKEGA